MLGFKCIHNEKKMKTILAKLKSLTKFELLYIHTIVCTASLRYCSRPIVNVLKKRSSALAGFGL